MDGQTENKHVIYLNAYSLERSKIIVFELLLLWWQSWKGRGRRLMYVPRYLFVTKTGQGSKTCFLCFNQPQKSVWGWEVKFVAGNEKWIYSILWAHTH